jgi:shikimate kinase
MESAEFRGNARKKSAEKTYSIPGGIYILGGIKHSGKSSIGKAAAIMLSIPFFDLDNLMVDKCGSGIKSARDIYNKYGKEGFQEIETDALENFIEYIKKEQIKSCILALGGGTIENSGASAILEKSAEESGIKIYLKAPRELLYSRIIKKGIPPFLSKENPEKDFSVLYSRRDSLYSAFADIIYTVRENVPVEENARNLCGVLEEKYAGKHIR